MRYYQPAGTSSSGQTVVRIEPDGDTWQHTGLLVLRLSAGETYQVRTSAREHLVVPLTGGLRADIDGHGHALGDRASVWQVGDVLYIPVDVEARLIAMSDVEVALPWAVADRSFPVQRIDRDRVPVELRGAGVCSREVRNFGVPGILDADRLIVCEVLTPGGNWSSYPPHKHDVANKDESQLEEIYYYKVRQSPQGAPGFGLQRAYGSAAGDFDLTEEVRSDDVVLIPFGYHGPSVAAPGHDLYYLNVMAGPARANDRERAWKITDDPRHAWIRESWADEPIDSRLPFKE
jgi:5-deoxy-glucuronate isomerase